MTINIENSVRDLVLSIPGATSVFAGLGIDYCCGGDQSLATACEKAKIPVKTVIDWLELAEESANPNCKPQDWQVAPLTELVDHIIQTHHVFTKNELAKLQELIDKVCLAHGQNHPELKKVKELTENLNQDLIPHMSREEQILFPHIKILEKSALNHQTAPRAFFGVVQNPIRMMMIEHDRAGEILRGIRRLTNDFALPGDACISFQNLYQLLENFEADLHQHIHLENNILFPRAIEIQGSYEID